MRSLSLQACKTRLRALLLALVIPLAMMAQTKKEIKGVVTDSKGQPAASVTVNVKGTNTNVVTKADGSFTIRAAEGEVLVFSAVNFAGYEETVTGSNSIMVSLKEKTGELNDVVVIGYGKASKKTLSSAVTTVKPEELNKGVISDVGQLLQGKVPGLNISSSGDPNKGASVVLRGASTINSPGGPFYVIDGVPGADITTIAPDDIASIDVLKDAAATAIYGNRAANGVIMVTTRKGKKGAAQTSYNGSVGIEKVSGRLKLMDANELKAYLAANGTSLSPVDDKGANTDWMKAIQREGATSQNHNLSISGGSEKSTYSASINYLNKEGILQKSKLERVIARIGLEHHALNDKVKFNLNVSNSQSKANYTPLQNVALLQAAIHLPTSPVKNADGSYFENFATSGYFNPVSIIENAKDDTKYSTLLGSFNTEVKLPFNLTYNINLSYQKTTSMHGEYYNSYYSSYYKSTSFYSNPDPGIGVGKQQLASLFGTNGAALRSAYENTTANLETFLTWDKRIKAHNFNVVLGYSYQRNTSGDGLQATNTNFISDYTGYQNLAQGNYAAVSGNYTVQFGDNTYGETKFISDFARLNYSFKDRYLLQGSIRRDGSSVFGGNNQWGYFPSLGLGWRMKEEEFLKNVNFISDLKLRASYGETGNALGFGPYSAQQIYSSLGTYYNNGAFATAMGIVQGANPDLKWEKTATKNLGLDFSLFNNKVGGSIEVYEKVTTGMVFKYQVNTAIVPGGSAWGNGGKMTNRGIEISLNTTPVKTANFSWNTAINVAANRNRIVSMSGPEKFHVVYDSILYTTPEVSSQSGVTLQLLTAGRPLGQFFTARYAGKNSAGVSQFLKHDGTLVGKPTFRTDFWDAGSPHPKLLFGWTNTFRYKNLDLNVFLRGALGQKVYNATRAGLSAVHTATLYNLSSYASEDKVNDENNFVLSDRYIENASYVRVDNLTLGYNVKVKSEYVKSVRIYSTINNLLVITGYKGMDPEVNMGGASLGVDYNNFYPRTRTIMLGAMVNF